MHKSIVLFRMKEVKYVRYTAATMYLRRRMEVLTLNG